VHVFVRHSTVAGVRHNNRIVSPAEAKKAEIQLSKEPGKRMRAILEVVAINLKNKTVY
jgi:hypothetical protein